MTQLGPIDYAVISQALIASAREMGVKLIRSAYSTILREARDGSAGLMDRFGNTVTYHYSGDQLTDIAAGDGRHVTIAYDAGWSTTTPGERALARHRAVWQQFSDAIGALLAGTPPARKPA